MSLFQGSGVIRAILFGFTLGAFCAAGAFAQEDPLHEAIRGLSKLSAGPEAPQSPCRPGSVSESRGSNTACVPTSELAVCRRNGKGLACDKTLMSKRVRRRLQDLIVQAVNAQNEINRAEGKLEIHPATLMSFIGAESSGNPLQERSDGGKGLGQFTFPDSALRYGLDYHAPKPTSLDEAFSLDAPLRRDAQGRGIYSVWSPKGAILAMAAKLSEKLNAERFVVLRNARGFPQRREASVIYKGSDLLSTRYMASVYNRGNMVFNSIQEYYQQRGMLPETLDFGLDYGAVWETPRIQGQTPPAKSFPILFKECINRCHVEKIAGLCGLEPQGFFAEYSRDYVRRGLRWTASA